ncbi:MAG: hypothetical protein FE045_00540 [Thermoplasmata archaeon]|nr:MAG: hypothetical protein FE045_00540 [Thermoplasmata archaeon]
MKLLALMAFIIIIANPFLSINPEKGDEKKYMREWWNIDAFFNCGKNFSVTASFEYERETPAANLFLTIFDHDSNKVYDLGAYEESIDKLIVEKNVVRYEDCWIKIGNVYEAYFERKGVELYIKLEAMAPMQKIAAGIASNLPFGFGYYNYTFISKCMASGWIKIDGSKSNFTGIGYYEHVYGNWSYNKPMRFFSGNVLKDYMALYKWWRENMSIDFKNFTIWTNNPFGYDWSWGFFDNGYTLFFGNIPFWIKNVPMGIIYLYDGKKYHEFKLISYEYMEGKYYNGSFFPTKFRIKAIDGGSTLILNFEMKYKPHIYEDRLSSHYWKNLILYECPGTIYGWLNGSKSIALNGKGEIEIERQNSIFDYALLSISLKFPYPFGIELYFLSYLLKLSLSMQLYLAPPFFNFSFSKIG